MSVFNLPDVGEGLVEADIVAWHVKPGDQVKVNDVLVEIETAKSLVELPSPYEGTVGELHAEVGDTVAVGSPIISFGNAQAVDAPVVEAQASSIPAEPAESESAGKVLVGYGVSETSSATSVNIVRNGARVAVTPVAETTSPSEAATRPRATPPVRALAKQRSIDLAQVTGSGPQGRVLRADLESHAAQAQHPEASAVNTAASPATGVREERMPFKGVRKAIAQAMVRSYTEIPHANVSTEFDITPTMEFVAELKQRKEYAERRFTPLLFVAKALIRAVSLNPRINTIIDGDEIVQRHYVNLGIAAATPRGLIVPNIPNAHEMSLLELESAIRELVRVVREGKTTPEAQTGGTITITNAGIFGVDTGMPIINPGEPAIVGMGAVREKPWVVDGNIVPRQITNIGVSVDHRILDGDVAGSFLSDIVEALTDPRLLIVE